MDIIQERNSSNAVTANLTRAGNIGGILARTTSAGSVYYHSDGDGNVVQLTNSSGSVVGSYTYNAFGTYTSTGTAATANPYTFSSKEQFGGLYNFGYRYYMAGSGRWLNRDPLREAGGLNLYGYVGNDPEGQADGRGLESLWDDFKAGASDFFHAPGNWVNGFVNSLFPKTNYKSDPEDMEGATVDGHGFVKAGGTLWKTGANIALSAAGPEMEGVGAAGDAADCAGSVESVENIDPGKIRFSQNSAGGRGRAGLLRDSMARDGWSGPPIDAVRTPDGVTTLDNTRVAVARELNIPNIPVTVHAPGDPLPPTMIGRFGDAQTWGEALAQRTGAQVPPLPGTGTLDSPRMPG